ncbi:MAG: ABC transporter substrate-binding protein, partial [Treponemataceae bacterium]|nr:ABC transporter substrate-binding protein [Treponemataceae bacterium]
MKKGKPEGRGRFFFYLIVGLLVVFIVEVSCSPRPIKIGFIGGLSGYYADLGIAGRNGLRLALEEANREGGIDGHPLQLLTNDDKQDPQEARRSYKALVAEGVIA